ncbi:MAG: hypothetical protein GWN73_23930, partial [Actinobacteria bacterium]|nr:hypothetical protein [Actinomycetota bacterium]NIU68290.1 hypothetical protein [Actinomycetota bacterium]NIW30105.1 hypothetical protein [Actinomycetota bacterium]
TLAALALALDGCRRTDDGGDGGPDASLDTGTTDTGTGDAPGGDGATLDPSSADAVRALTRGAGAAAALVGPLLTETEALRDDARAETSGDTRRTAVRERIERAVAGESIVTDGTCVTFDWMLLALRVTITFSGCVMEATGEPLDGALTLDVNVGPTEVILTFDSLVIADVGIDGEVGLRVGGTCTEGDPDCTPCADGDEACAEMQMNQQTIWADITFVLDGESVNVMLSDVTIAHDTTGTTIGGTGTISSPTFDGSFVATDVKWEPMECLPSSGTVLYTPTGGTPVTVTLLATTPDDGIVEVEIPPFPAVPYELFPPCPATM